MIKIQLLRRQLAQYPHIVLDYKSELLRLCQFSAEGITVDEMVNYLALANRIERAEDAIELEPNEHAVLLFRLKTHRWNLIIPEIIEFVREFEAAGQLEESL